jgi:release factor glutamine methyltransferase
MLPTVRLYGCAVESEQLRGGVVQRLRAAGCVFAEDEADIILQTSTEPARVAELVAQRSRGVPLEHVVGWASFAGLRLVVHPGVFVPRRRTEALARQAIAVTPVGGTVLDLCCGCGAIGAAIASSVRNVRLWASDIDPAAVANARQNLRTADAVVSLGDMDDAVPVQLRGRVDVIVANVPYVPSAHIAYLPAEAREHESRVALDGGTDGLDVLRRLAPRAVPWLCPDGWMLTECSTEQAWTAAAVLRDAGLKPLVRNDSELDVAIVAGQR